MFFISNWLKCKNNANILLIKSTKNKELFLKLSQYEISLVEVRQMDETIRKCVYHNKCLIMRIFVQNEIKKYADNKKH